MPFVTTPFPDFAAVAAAATFGPHRASFIQMTLYPAAGYNNRGEPQQLLPSTGATVVSWRVNNQEQLFVR